MTEYQNFIENFINSFKNRPALWQIKSEIYKNKVQKEKALEELLEIYKEIEPQATVDDMKKKINSLRASYRRELQKVKKSEKSGAGAEDIYVPSLWYYKNLDFLRDVESQAEGYASFDDSLDEERPKAAKRKKTTEDEFLEKAVKHLEKSGKKPEKDEAEIYAEGWAIQFRKLEGDQKLLAKQIIDDALIRAQMRLLSYGSTINQHPMQQQFFPFQPRFDNRFLSSTPNFTETSMSSDASMSSGMYLIPNTDNIPRSFHSVFNSSDSK